MSIFHPLGVVGRGSETQLQVGENLNKILSNLADRGLRHATLTKLGRLCF